MGNLSEAVVFTLLLDEKESQVRQILTNYIFFVSKEAPKSGNFTSAEKHVVLQLFQL